MKGPLKKKKDPQFPGNGGPNDPIPSGNSGTNPNHA